MEDVVDKVLKALPERQPESLAVSVVVDDPLVVRELLAFADGEDRNAFVLTALRIGVLALKQAQGRLDADVVRNEGERLLASFQQQLREHRDTVRDNVTRVLQDYFDPNSGRFSERVEKLIKDGGDLERAIKAQVGETDSTLAKTLATSFGATSPLMKLLDPKDNASVTAAITKAVTDALSAQSKGLLAEFSLDNRNGALYRLVGELKLRETELSSGLQTKVNEVIAEFSLDKPDSALSRLVQQMDSAQRKINSEFSLDASNSALARLKTSLEALIQKQGKDNEEFRVNVTASLAALTARKEEAKRSTRHGVEFEDAVLDELEHHCVPHGDIVERTGTTTGLMSRQKVGDAVIHLGPGCEAAGARVVVEAKQKNDYDLKKALVELEVARKNRDAQVGLFVYSRRSAPDGVLPMFRYAKDVVAVWDPEDTTTDPYLHAAISLCRALCVKNAAEKLGAEADVEAIQRAIFELEKQIEGLDEIKKSAETIKRAADNIDTRAGRIAQTLERSTGRLNDEVEAIKRVLAEG